MRSAMSRPALKRIKDPFTQTYRNNSNLEVIENMKKRKEEKELASHKTTNGSINSTYEEIPTHTVNTGNLSRQSEHIAQIVNEEECEKNNAKTLKIRSLELDTIHSHRQSSEERNVDQNCLCSKSIDIQTNGLYLTNASKNIEISHEYNFKTNFNFDMHMKNESTFGETKMDTNGIELVNIDDINDPAIPDPDKFCKSIEQGKKYHYTYIDSDRQKLDNTSFHSNRSTEASSKDSRFQENKHTEEEICNVIAWLEDYYFQANEQTVELRHNNNEGLLEDSDFQAKDHKLKPRDNNVEATPNRQKSTGSKVKHKIPIRTNMTSQHNFQLKGSTQLHGQRKDRSWIGENSGRQDDSDLNINQEVSKPYKNEKTTEYCIRAISSRVPSPDIEACLRYEQQTKDRTAHICSENDNCNPRGSQEVLQMQVIEPTISKTCCTEFRPHSQLYGLQNGTLCFNDTETKCLASAKTVESPKTVFKKCGYSFPICTSLCPLTNTTYCISMNENRYSSFYCYDAVEKEPKPMFENDIQNILCMAYHKEIGIIVLSNLPKFRKKPCISIYTEQGRKLRSEMHLSKSKHRNLSICQQTQQLALSGGNKVEVLSKNLREVSTHIISSSHWKSFRKFGRRMLFCHLKSLAKFDKYGNLVICSNRSDKIRVVSANTGICIRKLLIKGFQFNIFDFSKDNEIIVLMNDQQKCIYIKYLGIVATLDLELRIRNLGDNMEQMRNDLEKENAALKERIYIIEKKDCTQIDIMSSTKQNHLAFEM